jgi:hypothetical protein
MPRRKNILEGGSTVELGNVERFIGNRSKRYRKDNGQYDSDSNHEPDIFDW